MGVLKEIEDSPQQATGKVLALLVQ